MDGERKRYRALTGITFDGKVYAEGDHLLLDALMAARLLAIVAVVEDLDTEAEEKARAQAEADAKAKADAEANAEAEAEANAAAAAAAAAEARAKFETWPPTDEQIATANHEVLGSMLTGMGVDPKPFNSKDARRAAIRELIAKQKDQVNT